MEIHKVKEVIEKIQSEACVSEEETFRALEGYLPDIIAVYMALIEELPVYKQQGVELPEDVILQQVRNLEEAVQHKDMIKLYDTLKYEVLNTFEIYHELKTEMGGHDGFLG